MCMKTHLDNTTPLGQQVFSRALLCWLSSNRSSPCSETKLCSDRRVKHSRAAPTQNTTSSPEAAERPVSPHIVPPRPRLICPDRSAVGRSATWRRPFAAQRKPTFRVELGRLGGSHLPFHHDQAEVRTQPTSGGLEAASNHPLVCSTSGD